MRPHLLALLPVAAAGCAMLGPDFERPQVVLPERYAETVEASGTLTAVPANWWRLYEEPELDRLVEAGLVHNTDVRLAAARIEETAAVLREAQAALLPLIQGNADAGRSRSSQRVGTSSGSGSTPAVRNNYRLAATAAFELDIWGRLRRLREAAGADFLASRYGRDAVMQALSAAIAQSYFTIRSLDTQIVMSTESLRIAEESVEIARTRANAGLVSDLDVYQAQGNQAQIAAQIKDLRRLRAVAVHRLGVLTGALDLRLDASGSDPLPSPPLPPAGLPSALLERRPDVRRAEAAFAVANAQIGVARAAQFPTLSLTAALGVQSVELGTLLTTSAGIWSFGVGAVGPIFDAGRYAARTEQAEARARQAAILYEQTVENAFREVSDALSNVRLAAEAEADLASRVAQARNTLRLASMRYESGYSAYLDVLDAQRTLNDAQLALSRNRQLFLGFTVDLMSALGGGWLP
ncbi:MAG: efflux transporter outer membrane subunit [Burkholderiales bacterium]|nr:efflux transporter outer membrane subunit [Burkholderiales bacterium]